MRTFEQLNKGRSIWRLYLDVDDSTNILKYSGHIQLDEWFVTTHGPSDNDDRWHFQFADSKEQWPNKVIDVYLPIETRQDKESPIHHSCKILEHSYQHGFMTDPMVVVYPRKHDWDEDPEFYFYCCKTGPEYFITDLDFVEEIIHNFKIDLNARIKKEMHDIKNTISRQRKNINQFQDRLYEYKRRNH